MASFVSLGPQMFVSYGATSPALRAGVWSCVTVMPVPRRVQTSSGAIEVGRAAGQRPARR